MGLVKFTRVVSCSSEDPNQPAENLVKDGTYRKWRCKSNGEQKIWVELELEKACFIQGIDVGNNGSAFVEVLVGRTGFSESEYKVILNSSSFMSPQEARNETNMQRVRMFKAHELNKTTLNEKWDRIRVVCTQPFNQHVKYGLSFITVHTGDETANKTTNKLTAGLLSDMNFGLFKLKDECPVDSIKQGTVFSKFKNPGTSSAKTISGTGVFPPQTLADAVLAESEVEARNALKPSPLKADRPAINLGEKLKAIKEPGAKSDHPHPVAKRILTDSKLPSRKDVEGPSIKPTKIDVEKRKEIKSDPDQRKRHIPSSNGSNHSRETASTPKRRTPPSQCSAREQEPPAKKTRKTKPFNKLLEGVFVVLSGFQNPLRSQLRDKLLAMGAKYKPEWNPQCTHLVSAFPNTPKFREVKGKGKIVTKDWIEQCYSQRKRLPWRRFHLDRDDKGPESEEEVWAEGQVGEDSYSSANTRDFPATSEDNKPRTGHQTTKRTSPDIGNGDDNSEDYGSSTEIDDPDTEDEIELARTEIQKEEKDQNLLSQLPKLPSFFRGFVFCVKGHFDPKIRLQLLRYITAFNGELVEDIGPTVSHVITDGKRHDSRPKVHKDKAHIKYVQPDWIWECSRLQKWIPTDNYEV